EATVRRIWKEPGLRPHRMSTFKASRDPPFVQKLTDAVGLSLNPPDKAVGSKSNRAALTARLVPQREGTDPSHW
ncbi:MAG: IS630 family transposase, partial [Terriglobia bacterium]